MKKKKNYAFAILISLSFLYSCEDSENYVVENVDFEHLTLGENGYWNGSDGSGPFTYYSATFHNEFTDWGGGYTSWNGFAISSINDIQTPGLENQYSAYVASIEEPLNKYGICYILGDNAKIIFDKPVDLLSIKATNSTYCYWSMKNGDQYSKKFGGLSGTDPDWFKLTIKGYDIDGFEIITRDFMLADYRSSSSSDDYIINGWETVDLSMFNGISEIRFYLSSTDNGDFGMNTPAYFCLDNLRYRYLKGNIE